MTFTPTSTYTPSISSDPTISATETSTPSFTANETLSATESASWSESQTNSQTISETQSQTPSQTSSQTISATQSQTPSQTSSQTISQTQSQTASQTSNPTISQTQTSTNNLRVSIQQQPLVESSMLTMILLGISVSGVTSCILCGIIYICKKCNTRPIEPIYQTYTTGSIPNNVVIPVDSIAVQPRHIRIVPMMNQDEDPPILQARQADVL